MRARTVILLLFAVVLAAGTAMLARAWLNAHKGEPTAQAAPIVVPAPTKFILVARAAVLRGQILRSTDLTWQQWPENALNKTYIVQGMRNLDAFAGSVARNPMVAGEPVTDAKVVAPGNRGFLAAVLRPGMRAVSVPVTATSGISGFVFPGDQVDILVTYTIPSSAEAGGANTDKVNNQMEHKAAETVLHNVRVIGIDQRLESKPGEAAIAHTATLEVTPKQSEIVALASEMGKLSLSLRSLATLTPEAPADTAEGALAAGDSRGHATAATFTLDSEVSPLLPKPFRVKETPESNVVTILRGGAKPGESSGTHPPPRGS